MKKLIVIASIFMLTACSSFKMGGVAYCPYDMNCAFQQTVKISVPTAGNAVAGSQVAK